jgi:hypothetical protein
MRDVKIDAARAGYISLDEDGLHISAKARVTGHSVDAVWIIIEDIFELGDIDDRDELLTRIRDHLGSADLCNAIISALDNNEHDVKSLYSIAAEVDKKMRKFKQHVNNPVIEEMAEMISIAQRFLPSLLEGLAMEEMIDCQRVLDWTMPVEESDNCEHGNDN